MILGSGIQEGLLLKPVTYPWAYDLYNQAVANTWFPNEVQLDEDLAEALAPWERAMVEEMLACSVVGGPAAVRQGVAAFAERFPQAAILVTGVEDPDTRAHAANESLHLGEFERVCVAETLLLARLGAMPRA